MRQIKSRSTAAALVSVLILVGHRRMGKTSIIRNLGQVALAGTMLVHLDMRNVCLIDHAGPVLSTCRRRQQAGHGGRPRRRHPACRGRRRQPVRPCLAQPSADASAELLDSGCCGQFALAAVPSCPSGTGRLAALVATGSNAVR